MSAHSDDDNTIIINDHQNIINSENEMSVNLQSTDLCEDINSQNIPIKLEDIELQIDRLKQRWNEFTYLIGQRLNYIHKNNLYLNKGYHDFGSYVKIALKMSENNAYYYIAIYQYFTEEQTKIAGSKLKLIIPVLNKIKRDQSKSNDEKEKTLDNIKAECYTKIKNLSYRDAEKVIKSLRMQFFNDQNDKNTRKKKIDIKKDRIIIYEDDELIQEQVMHLIEQFYLDY